jgi:hypothetical protein
MKPVNIGSSIGLDSLATWSEVMCAISVSAEGALALGGCNDLHERDSDFSVSACNLPDDDMSLAIARDMPDSKCN